MGVAELHRDPRDWQRRMSAARAAGTRIVLVPTMGYLHDGHLSLLREARRRAGADGLAVASIFVNPTQFGPREDLARYPRDLEGDLAKCAAAGIDAVLAPQRPEQVFSPEHETWIATERTSVGLCGARRPGHFRGVATVVAKLFHLTSPHAALFGEKDWQQLQVIRAMVRDLDFDVEVVGMPIVREPDGLALSSRNAYLGADERRRALALSRVLATTRERVGGGERDARRLAADAVAELERAGARVDYVEIVHPTQLSPLALIEPGSRMLLAAWLGATRLIDNAALA